MLEGQLNAVADKLSEDDWAGVVIAYEPVRLFNFLPNANISNLQYFCAGAADLCERMIGPALLLLMSRCAFLKFELIIALCGYH